MSLTPKLGKRGRFAKVSMPLFRKTGMGRPLKRRESQKTCLNYGLYLRGRKIGLYRRPLKNPIVEQKWGLCKALYRSKGKKGTSPDRFNIGSGIFFAICQIKEAGQMPALPRNCGRNEIHLNATDSQNLGLGRHGK